MNPLVLHSICAKACLDIYDPNPPGFDHIWRIKGIVLGHRVLQGGSVDLLAARGSDCLQDWYRDALAAVPYEDEVLGIVAAGFYDGIPQVFNNILPEVGRNVVLTGHSLGADHVWDLAGLFVHTRRPARQITVFGSPRPGGNTLKELILSGGSDITSYKNLNDYVTDVPPPLFCHHVTEFTALSCGRPSTLESPFNAHHMPLYDAGLLAAGIR